MSEFPYVLGYKASRRDAAVAAVVNWIITTFASAAYTNFITDLIRLGRNEFEKRLVAEKEKLEEADGDTCGKPCYEFTYTCIRRAGHTGDCDV